MRLFRADKPAPASPYDRVLHALRIMTADGQIKTLGEPTPDDVREFLRIIAFSRLPVRTEAEGIELAERLVKEFIDGTMRLLKAAVAERERPDRN